MCCSDCEVILAQLVFHVVCQTDGDVRTLGEPVYVCAPAYKVRSNQIRNDVGLIIEYTLIALKNCVDHRRACVLCEQDAILAQRRCLISLSMVHQHLFA